MIRLGANWLAELKERRGPGQCPNASLDLDGYSVTYSHGAGMDVETTALSAMASHESRLLARIGETGADLAFAREVLLRNLGLDAGHHSGHARSACRKHRLTRPGIRFRRHAVVQWQNRRNLPREQGQQRRHAASRPDPAPSAQGKTTSSFGRCPPESCLFNSRAPIGSPPCRQPINAPGPAQSGPLQIELQYDRTTLSVNDQLNCGVTVKNNTAPGHQHGDR